MHPAGKVIGGLILIAIGLGLFVLPEVQIVNWLGNFITVLTGVIPIFLIIIGLFVVWLEADELKTQKELSKPMEEEKEKPKKGKKK